MKLAAALLGCVSAAAGVLIIDHAFSLNDEEMSIACVLVTLFSLWPWALLDE